MRIQSSQQDSQPKGIDDAREDYVIAEDTLSPNRTPSRKALMTAWIPAMLRGVCLRPNRTPSRKALMTDETPAEVALVGEFVPTGLPAERH